MAKDIEFNFWCPVEISKAIDQNTGEEVMLLGGIASTADEDSDGEFLDPKGFDINPLLESGMVNWHHQAKTNPGTIVGEPTKAEIRDEGLYIETKLYPSSQIAKDIWELAKTLDQDSDTRRLGYSIEGKVLERKSNDRNSPDYKKISKAVITGVAITHQPKNPKTFANIIKGDIEDDFDDEEENKKNDEDVKSKEDEYYKKVGIKNKSLDTTTARSLIKESVDDELKVTTFGKAEVMERIFKDIPTITLQKAENIYTLINKIAAMAKRNVTEEDIQKAYDALGLDPDESLLKGRDDSEEDSEDEDDYTDDEEDSEDGMNKSEDEDESDDEDDEEEDDTDEEDEDESDDEDDEEEDVKKSEIFNRFSRLEKAISTSHLNNATYIKALGVMVKSSNQNLEKAIDELELANKRIEELSDINKSQMDEINSLSERLEAYGSSSPMPKSIRHSAAVNRNFSKGNVNDFGNEDAGNIDENSISIMNKAAVTEILDQATFAKGFDEEFSKACLDYEASGNISGNIISRIKNEFGISIVK
jgi:hypothetical protein